MAKICAPAGELVKEHSRLVKTLKSGSKRALQKEAGTQGRELKEYRSKARSSGRR